MAFGPELIARLGLDTTAFSRGLANANSSVENWKRTLKGGDVGRTITSLFGAGAIIEGFRATINRAQEARNKARELNKTVDEGTASVARYGDAWDKIKTAIGDAAIVGLSFFTRAGEAIGKFVNDQVVAPFRDIGTTPTGAKRTREISEKAAANAERLSSPQALAAAAARGEARKKADEQGMKDVAKLMNEGAERRAQTELEALPIAKQIAELERQKAEQEKIFADESKSALVRAQAFNQATKISAELVKKKADQEKQADDEAQRRRKRFNEEFNKSVADEEEQRKKSEDKARRIFDLGRQQQEAQASVDAARKNLATAQTDRHTITLGEAAAGMGGATQTSKARARQILSLEARAKRIFQSGTSDFRDPQGHKISAADYAQQLQSRADDLRKKSGFLSSADRDPMAAQTKAVVDSERHLQAIKDALTEEVKPSGK